MCTCIHTTLQQAVKDIRFEVEDQHHQKVDKQMDN
jgi:hypothetical protein